MSIVPTTASNDVEHPAWCSPEFCDLGQPMRLGDHRSEPVTIPPAKIGDPRIEIWLEQWLYEDPATSPIRVITRLMWVDQRGEVEEATSSAVPLETAREWARSLAQVATVGESS